VRFDEFEEQAWQEWERVPAEYKAGIDGLIVERDAHAHPRFGEVYTLGECVTESFPSPFGGPDTTRSSVVLYYGSFLRLSHQDPEFDWQEELWETLTHELKHHLEALASEDDLEALDYAVDENFKRLEGVEFDPLFYRSGEPVEPGVFKVEEDVFVELEVIGQPRFLEVELTGQRFRFAPPHNLGDICFVELEGALERPHMLTAVLMPKRSLLDVARRFVKRGPVQLHETTAIAEPVS